MADTAIDITQLAPGWERGLTTAPPVTPQVMPPAPAAPPSDLSTGQSYPATGTEAWRPPAQAIQTGPTQGDQQRPGTVPPDFDDNRDMPTAEEIERSQFGKTYSHRGDFREVLPQAPARQFEEHPEYAKLQQLQELYGQITNPKEKAKAGTMLQSMKKRMETQTAAENKRAATEYHDREKRELSKADAQYVSPTQTPELNSQVSRTELEKQFTDEIEKTPSRRLEVERRMKTSPLSTLTEDEMLLMAREIQGLNRRFSLKDAMGVVMQAGTPPQRGTKGANGATGRGATTYRPYGTDVLGNPIVQTNLGRVRIPADTFTSLKKARIKGYDLGLQHDKEIAEKRKAEGEPGFIARTIEGILK